MTNVKLTYHVHLRTFYLSNAKANRLNLRVHFLDDEQSKNDETRNDQQ